MQGTTTPSISIVTVVGLEHELIVYGNPFDVRKALSRSEDGWFELDAPGPDGAGGLEPVAIHVPVAHVRAIQEVSAARAALALRELAAGS